MDFYDVSDQHSYHPTSLSSTNHHLLPLYNRVYSTCENFASLLIRDHGSLNIITVIHETNVLARRTGEEMKRRKESQGVQLNVISKVYKIIVELIDGDLVMSQKLGL